MRHASDRKGTAGMAGMAGTIGGGGEGTKETMIMIGQDACMQGGSHTLFVRRQGRTGREGEMMSTCTFCDEAIPCSRRMKTFVPLTVGAIQYSVGGWDDSS